MVFFWFLFIKLSILHSREQPIESSNMEAGACNGGKLISMVNLEELVIRSNVFLICFRC